MGKAVAIRGDLAAAETVTADGPKGLAALNVGPTSNYRRHIEEKWWPSSNVFKDE